MVFIGLPALAHAQLIEAYPKANQVLTSSPTEFKLIFSDTLINLGPNSNWLRVEDSRGELVSSQPEVRGGEVFATAVRDLQPGKYELSWRVLSEDGHPVQGSYSFTISTPNLTFISRAQSQKQVTLRFSEALAPGTKVTVIGPASKAIKGSLELSAKQAIFRFATKLAPGKYQIFYRAKSAGGQTINGKFTLTQR